MSDIDLIRQVNRLQAIVDNLVEPEIPIVRLGARVYNSANISIPNNSFTALTFDSERFDTDSIHSTVVNTSRLTIQTAGKYIIVGQVRFAAAAGGRRQIRIFLNGATIISSVEPNVVADGTANPKLIATTIYDLAVGEYVELEAFQDSGGAINVLTSANFSPEFMIWILP